MTNEPTAALGVKPAAHVLRIVNEAKRRGLEVIFLPIRSFNVCW
jgi:simple sugar transport system ATP-binding protein